MGGNEIRSDNKMFVSFWSTNIYIVEREAKKVLEASISVTGNINNTSTGGLWETTNNRPQKWKVVIVHRKQNVVLSCDIYGKNLCPNFNAGLDNPQWSLGMDA